MAVCGSAGLFGVLVADSEVLLWAALIIGVPLFVFAAPPWLVVWVMAAAGLTVTSAWPSLTSAGGVDVNAGDAALLLVATAALVRRQAGTRNRLIFVILLFVALGVVRSEFAGAVAFIRMLEPLITGIAVGMYLRSGYNLWRDVRWICVILIATVPLVGGLDARWAGLPGGPNEVGLIAAVVTVLGTAERNKPLKLILIGVGLVGLVGSKGIAATIALIAGLAMLSRTSRSGWFASTYMGRVHPFLIALAGMLAVAFVPVVRPDLANTVNAHATQAGVFGELFARSDPLVGSGWAQFDRAAFTYARYQDLHDVYLDIAAYLGIAGIALFVLMLCFIFRVADQLTRAVLVCVAVWFNTIGAFPGPGWGMIGLAVAAALSHDRLHSTTRCVGSADAAAPVIPARS